MLHITDDIVLRDDELEWHAIRAQGAGGQNVNKVATAINLRFDLHSPSLPAAVRERLLRSEVDLAGLLDLYGQVRQGKRVV